jgi:GNAT superfamily N-acetyltransferase
MDRPTISHGNSEEPVIEIAKVQDAPAIKVIVDAAYSKYIELMGMIPAAMRVKYDKLIETREVYVLRVGGEVVGSIILGREDDSITINNLVVAPSLQGRGFGRLFMKYVENKALEKGLAAVQLFANEKMYDNLSLYPKMGFIETGRKTEDGYNRVYFRKNLT